MHGMVHAEFRDYGISRLGYAAWARLCEDEGLATSPYTASQVYPDDDLLTAVMALARRTDEPVDTVLTAFGQAIVPTLLRTYGPLIQPSWGAADVLENVERVIHRAVRLQDPEATPPYLTAERVAPDEVILHYTSPRKLCAFGKGLVHGVAGTYAETADITERTCMHRGDRSCVLQVRLAPLDRGGGA